jgi:uncharacterized membrane protein
METTPIAAGTESTRLLHPGFVAAGAALLIAALATDLLYYESALFQWANFSMWLITGGLILALLAGVLLLVDLFFGRAGPIRWIDLIVLTVAALLSLLNALIHGRDAWTSVVPQGLLLSAVVTLLLLFAGWRGWSVTAVRADATGHRP